jgi:hypothetical protein
MRAATCTPQHARNMRACASPSLPAGLEIGRKTQPPVKPPVNNLGIFSRNAALLSRGNTFLSTASPHG